jgi:hypothetical protein
MELQKCKAVATAFLNTRFKLGEAVNYDSSAEINRFWSALVSCVQSVYPEDKRIISDNEIVVKFADYFSVSFFRNNEGVFYKVRHPFMISTVPASLIKGESSQILCPNISVSDTFDTICLWFDYPFFAKAWEDDNFYRFLAILLYLGRTVPLSYNPSSNSFEASLTNAAIPVDEIPNEISGHSISFPQNVAYFVVDYQARIQLEGDFLRNYRVDFNFKNTVSFYDNGIVVEPIISLLSTTGSAVVPYHLLDFSLTVRSYNADDDLIGTGHIHLYAPEASAGSSALTMGSSLSRRFHRFIVKMVEDETVARLTELASDNQPSFSYSGALDVEVGDVVVVFNMDNYAYRTVVQIDDNTITLDSDIPFDLDSEQVFISNTVPLGFFADFGVKDYKSDRFNSVPIKFTRADYTDFFDQGSSHTLSSKYFVVGFKLRIDTHFFLPSVYAFASTSSERSVAEFLASVLQRSSQPFPDDARVNIALPKIPVADGELDSSFLQTIKFLKPSNVLPSDYLRNTAIPLTLVQENQEGKFDFIGFVPMIAAFSMKPFFSSKGFVNNSPLRNDSASAFVVEEIEANQDLYLYKVGPLVHSNKGFLAG